MVDTFLAKGHVAAHTENHSAEGADGQVFRRESQRASFLPKELTGKFFGEELTGNRRVNGHVLRAHFWTRQWAQQLAAANSSSHHHHPHNQCSSSQQQRHQHQHQHQSQTEC